MPHPIYGDPNHRLERVEFTLIVPTAENGRRTALAARGTSGTARAGMWLVQEEWSAAEQERGYQPADALQHIALVALQDRPTSQSQVEACLIGEGWCQNPLF